MLFASFTLTLLLYIRFSTQQAASLSSFQFARPIFFPNPFGTEQTTIDAAVVFSTSNLILSSKLASACTDLFFVPSGISLSNASNERLSYWIESGCNSDRTFVWVRIERLPVSGLVVDMVYGAPKDWSYDAAVVGAETFHGRLVLASHNPDGGAECPGNPHFVETVENPGNADFVVAFVDSGGTFGDLDGDDTHAHVVNNAPFLPSATITIESDTTDPSAAQVADVTGSEPAVVFPHDHEYFTLYLGYRTNLNMLNSANALLNVRMCEMEGTSGSHMTVPGVVSGLLVLFDDPTSYDDAIASSDFVVFDANERYMIVKTGSFANTNMDLPIGPIEHHHNQGGNYMSTRTPDPWLYLTGGPVASVTTTHAHLEMLAMDASTTSSAEPECTWVGAVEANATSMDNAPPLPFGAVVVATEHPPLGFEWVDAWDLFPRITTSSALVGVSLGCGSATHSHTATFPGPASSQCNPTSTGATSVNAGGDFWVATNGHTHTRTLGTGTFETPAVSTHNPESVKMMFVRKKKATNVTVGIVGGPEVLLIWDCYGTDSKDTGVCGGNGHCLSQDNCNCTAENGYGSSCGEVIPGVGVFTSPTEMFVDWVVPITLLQDYVSDVEDLLVNCSSVVDVAGGLDDVAFVVCRFSLPGVVTDGLVIQTDSSSGAVPDGDSVLLEVHPLTDSLVSVDVSVSPFVEPEEDEVDLAVVFSVTGAVGGLIAIVVLLLLIVALGFIVAVCSNRKKLEILDRLDDVDIILQEQAVRRQDEAAGSVFHRMNVHKSLFVVDYDSVELVRQLGSGGSDSIVYLANWENQEVAFKAFNVSSSFNSERMIADFEKEISIAANVTHPHVLAFFGAAVKPPRIGIVFEYCQSGDLEAYLREHPDFPLEDRIRLVFEISSGMEYLHSHNIIHRDLKTRNVLLNASLEAKIADFGLSRIFEKSDADADDLTLRVGTIGYLSPESVVGSTYNEKVDVFAFGVVAYEVLTGDMAWYGETHNPHYRVSRDPEFRPKVRNPKLAEDIGPELLEIMSRCVKERPDDRPSFSEISHREAPGQGPGQSLNPTENCSSLSKRSRVSVPFSPGPSHERADPSVSRRWSEMRLEQDFSRLQEAGNQLEQVSSEVSHPRLSAGLAVFRKASRLGLEGSVSEWRRLLDEFDG